MEFIRKMFSITDEPAENGQPRGLPQDTLEIPMPEVEPPRSLIGGVVVNINAGLQSFKGMEAQLVAEITAKSEALRQVRAGIQAMEIALTDMSDDAALTDREREMAAEPFNRKVIEPMEAEIDDQLTNAQYIRSDGLLTEMRQDLLDARASRKTRTDLMT